MLIEEHGRHIVVPCASLHKRSMTRSMSDRNPFYSMAGSMLAGLPGIPSKFTKHYITEDVIARCNRRIDVLEDRIEDVAEGRVMPDRDDVTISSAPAAV